MDYIEKINEIISLLVNENNYQEYGVTNKAVYWKMGTSFFTMFDRLYKNIKNKDIRYPIKVFKDKEHKTTEGNNISYQLKINGINVTPCKVRGYVSANAIHQYMRSITGFGLGAVEKKYKNLKDFVELGYEIKLSSNIVSMLLPKNRINLILDIIVNSLFNNIKYQRDIAYSILIETLITYDFNFNNLIGNNQIFSFNRAIGPRNQKSIKEASLIKDINLIKKDIFRQGTKATYKEIIECIKNEYPNLELFINDIWNQYKTKDNDDEFSSIIINQIEHNNLINSLKRKRSQFKENIFEDRKSKGLIWSKDDLYSDIVGQDNSIDSLLVKFNESEAAHIYEVNTIKQKLIEQSENKDELLNYVSDPNNGIMMETRYHKSFDRRQWFFDANGEMVIPEENQDYLLNVKKLKRIKINDKVFNNNMKEFLLKR